MSVAASVDCPKETGRRNIHNLVHYLSPKNFFKMFKLEKCTPEEKLIREILERVCALRNSGGGKLTLCFTGTYSTSDADWCIEYIKKAVNEVLSATATETDLVELKLPNRVTFLIKSSKKIVIMKCNVITFEAPKIVPPTTSAAELRALSQHPKKQEQRDISDDDTEKYLQPVQKTLQIRKETPVLPSPQVVELVKDQNISNTQLLPHDERVAFKRLEKIKEEMTISHRITHKRNDLLAYVLHFANHRGGRLYYGISFDGNVCGEKISKQEKKAVRQEVKKEIELILRPEDKIEKFWKITFLPVKDCDCLNLYVIEIRIRPCNVGLEERLEAYHLGEYGVERLPFSDRDAHLQDSTTGPDMTKIIEFKTIEEAFKLIFLPEDYTKFLESLDWVESCRVVDKNEECDAPHLEIVCKLGKVPRTADIVNYFGEEILPFITYQECSMREWFETNIFDESYEIKEEYDNKLSSFSWVTDYDVGVAIKPEKSWQIYITCAKNEVPRMDELKELFGVNIGYFVDFVKESVDEDTCSASCLLRGPVAGDDLLVEEQQPPGSGTISILATATVSDEVKQYAITCYHVCFQRDLPKTTLGKQHEILQNDFENNAEGCRGVNYEYTHDENRDLLGQFGYGLYNDDHDIALVTLQQNLDCTHAIDFLAKKGITLSLANRKEVTDAFYDAKVVPAEINGKTRKALTVKKIGAETGVTTGYFYAARGRPRCERYKRCYKVTDKPGTIFARKGDSGSLVYLIEGKKKIPFGYLCVMEGPEADTNVYYCRNLSWSMEEMERRHHELNTINPCLPNPNAQE